VIAHAALFAGFSLLAGAASYALVERYFLIQKRHLSLANSRTHAILE
jgi:hypothetical protein